MTCWCCGTGGSTTARCDSAAASRGRRWRGQRSRRRPRQLGSTVVMLGTDYPFDMGVTDPVERAAAAGLPTADLTAILSAISVDMLAIGSPDSNQALQVVACRYHARCD